jgi:hypothetical protein
VPRGTAAGLTQASASVPLLNIFWSMLLFFILSWIGLALMVIVDIFRRHDLSGRAKALWVILVILADGQYRGPIAEAR